MFVSVVSRGIIYYDNTLLNIVLYKDIHFHDLCEIVSTISLEIEWHISVFGQTFISHFGSMVHKPFCAIWFVYLQSYIYIYVYIYIGTKRKIVLYMYAKHWHYQPEHMLCLYLGYDMTCDYKPAPILGYQQILCTPTPLWKKIGEYPCCVCQSLYGKLVCIFSLCTASLSFI